MGDYQAPMADGRDHPLKAVPPAVLASARAVLERAAEDHDVEPEMARPLADAIVICLLEDRHLAVPAVSAENVLEELTLAGIDARMDHSGGGVYTVYVGKPDAEGRHPALVGPFHREHDLLHAASDRSPAGWDCVYVGPDDDGVTEPAVAGTPAQAVEQVKRVLGAG